jgi:hypothetical protein
VLQLLHNVLFLQILFVCIYALAYNDDDDDDRAVLAMAFLLTFTLNDALVTWELRKVEQSGFLSSVTVNDLILLLF